MAAVVVELSGDEAKLLKAYQKVRDAQSKMDDGLKKVKDSSDKAGQAGEQAGSKMDNSFGTRALGHLRDYAGGIATVTTAMTVLRGAVNILADDSRRALETLEGITETGMRLNQILQGDALDAAGQERNRLAMQTGVPLAELQALQFQAGSLGMSSSDVESLAMASGANLLSTEAATSVGGQVPLLFRESGVTSMQAVAGTLAAAAESPASFEEIGEYLPAAAEGAAQQRLSPAETIAATAVMREKFQMSTAAQRLNRFTANLAMDDRFAGRSLDESLNMLQEMSDADRNTFLGESIQMQGAYRALVDLQPRIRERTAVVQEAMADPEARISQLTRAAIDPSGVESGRNRARMEMERARRTQEVEDLRQAVPAAERETTAIRERVSMQSRGVNPIRRYIADLVMGAVKGVGGSSEAISFASREYQSLSTPDVAIAAQQGMAGNPASLVTASQALLESAKIFMRAGQTMDNATQQMDRNAQRAAVSGVPE